MKHSFLLFIVQKRNKLQQKLQQNLSDFAKVLHFIIITKTWNWTFQNINVLLFNIKFVKKYFHLRNILINKIFFLNNQFINFLVDLIIYIEWKTIQLKFNLFKQMFVNLRSAISFQFMTIKLSIDIGFTCF